MSKAQIVPSVRAAVRARGDYWFLQYSDDVFRSLRGLSALERTENRAFMSARLAILGKAAGVAMPVRMINYYEWGAI